MITDKNNDLIKTRKHRRTPFITLTLLILIFAGIGVYATAQYIAERYVDKTQYSIINVVKATNQKSNQ